MSSQDIVFILQSPIIRSSDRAQFHRTLEVSTAPLVTPRTHILTGKTIHQTSLSRLKRFNISSHTAQSPKARLSLTADSEPLLVSRQDDQRPEASHKRTLLQVVLCQARLGLKATGFGRACTGFRPGKPQAKPGARRSGRAPAWLWLGPRLLASNASCGGVDGLGLQ